MVKRVEVGFEGGGTFCISSTVYVWLQAMAALGLCSAISPGLDKRRLMVTAWGWRCLLRQWTTKTRFYFEPKNRS